MDDSGFSSSIYARYTKRAEKYTAVLFILWTVINLAAIGWIGWLQIQREGYFKLSEFFIFLLPWLAGVAGTILIRLRFKRVYAEQAQITSALQQSEERFRTLVDYSPDAILVFQIDNILFVNKTGLRMFGAAEKNDLLGKSILNLFHPDFRKSFSERIQELRQPEHTLPPLLEKVLRLDGRVLDVRLVVNAVYFAGKPAFQVTLEDISYQQKLERAIQSIEKGVSVFVGQAFFENAVTQLCDALGADYVFVGELLPTQNDIQMLAFCNGQELLTPKTYNLQNTPCENIVNKRVCCYPEHVAAMFPADTFLALNGVEGYVGTPLWNSKREPTGLFAALYKKPIHDIEFAKGLLQIFAGRVQAEMERNRVLIDLRKNEALLETVFNAIPFEVWVSDAEGACILQNPISRQHWGDTVGKLPKDLAFLPEEIQQAWRNKNLRALAGEVVHESQEIMINGQKHYLDSTMAPIQVGDKVNGFVGVNIDVTAQKEKETEIQNALSALQQSEALLEAVFENTPFDLWVADAEGVCIMQNPISRKLWGNTIGLVPDRQNVPPQLRNQWNRNNRRALAGETVRDPQVVDHNGNTYYLDTTLVPIRVGKRITGFVGTNIDLTERIKAENKTRAALERISVLRKIDQIILSGTDIQVIAKTIANEAKNLLHVDAVEILRYDGMSFSLQPLANQGLQNLPNLRKFNIYGDITRLAVLEQQQIFETDFNEFLKGYPDCQPLTKENFRTYVALPIAAKGIVRGIIEIFHREVLSPDNEWWDQVHLFANQAGIAIDNHLLFQGIQRSNIELSLAYDLTLEGWSRALELRDRETEGHTQRVTSLTVRLAEFIGVPRSQIVHIRRGALLHDIGKMGVPDEILRKNGPLTPEEWEIVKKHPVTAYNLLLPIPFLRAALDIPYCHHERWNGSGYPRGLSGEQIPIGARIFAVVDVWDALTSHRPYRKAESPLAVLAYIKGKSGTHFDPFIVKSFENLIRRSMEQGGGPPVSPDIGAK